MGWFTIIRNFSHRKYVTLFWPLHVLDTYVGHTYMQQDTHTCKLCACVCVSLTLLVFLPLRAPVLTGFISSGLLLACAHNVSSFPSGCLLLLRISLLCTSVHLQVDWTFLFLANSSIFKFSSFLYCGDGDRGMGAQVGVPSLHEWVPRPTLRLSGLGAGTFTC